MTLPERRKPEKMGLKAPGMIRCAAHLQWVRGHRCAVPTCVCSGFTNNPIEAAHVRRETDGGMGLKPSDIWAVPLCRVHHMLQHSKGDQWFEGTFKIDLRELAEEMARTSPHRSKWEKRTEAQNYTEQGE